MKLNNNDQNWAPLAMATAAGLVLGAVALLPIAFEGYQKCTNLFNCVRTFSSTFRKSSELLALQRRLFHRECRLLLRAVVSDDIAVEMISNKDHPTWKSPSFKAHWDQHLGSDFDIPIKHVQESLDAIERLLARIGDEEACPGNSSVWYYLRYVLVSLLMR